MAPTAFFDRSKSRNLWGNIFAMILVVGLLILGVRYALDVYTRHGEVVRVPDVRHKSFVDARHILTSMGLDVVVSDTGYVKSLQADCILEQTPGPKSEVKKGRTISVIINAAHSPMLSLPDIVDNSSLREATAKLRAMGFKVGAPQYVPGEKDWVYGVLVRGRQVNAGDRISVEDMVIIQTGNGMRDEDDSVEYIDADDIVDEEAGEVDEFQVVTSPE